MPCGGIFPANKDELKSLNMLDSACYYCCEHGDADHWVVEYDALIHADCVEDFLDTEEGQVIVDHGHSVVVRDQFGNTRTIAAATEVYVDD